MTKVINSVRPLSLKAFYQAFPRVFIQEPHGDIEGGTTPALQAVRVGEGVAGFLRDVDHIDGPQPCGEEGLMSITPSGVHDQDTRVLANGLRECLRTMLDDDVTPSSLARYNSIQRGTIGIVTVLEWWDGNFVLETWFTSLSFDRAAVDSEVSEVSKEFLGTVLTLNEFEEFRGVIDELSTRWNEN